MPPPALLRDTDRGVRRPLLGLLFLASMLLLGLGVWEHTGVTGKDEYYLGLRTPMCMVEQDVWLVPCLDGQPRLKKPPMLYWLTRASYESFGIGLTSARLVAVTLGSLLVLGIALTARELGASANRALLAGAIGLSFLSLGVGGRMLELDVPVAAFSTLAFFSLLRWYRRGSPWALPLASAWLAAGFLTKGPVVFVVCGAGGLALLATDQDARAHLVRHWHRALGALLLFALLALPWFVYVNQLYPERSAEELAAELASRRFLAFSTVPLYGSLMLLLPWSFVVLARIPELRALTGGERRTAMMLALWLGLTLVPFFFVRTFERYLFGSLVPAALWLALLPLSWSAALRWTARLGGGIGLAAAVALTAVAWWIAGWTWAMLPALAALVWFGWHWWRARNTGLMAWSAALLWAVTLGLVYPLLGINQVPPRIVELARGHTTVLYHGPQPGLLPALVGRSLIHVGDRWQLPPGGVSGSCEPFLVLTPEDESPRARDALRRLGLEVTERERFGVLSSRVSWTNMARRGLSRKQVMEALRRRDLDPIKPRVVLLQAERRQCPGG